MAWEIVLIESSISPPPEAFASVVDEALARIGVQQSITDEEIFTRDGGRLVFYGNASGGGMFRLRDFSPAIAEALFVIAEASNSFLADTSSGQVIRTAANGGLLGDENYDSTVVESPDALHAALGDTYESAEAYTRQVVASIGTDPKPPSFFGRLFGGLFGKAN